jgi:hypothetical protein
MYSQNASVLLGKFPHTYLWLTFCSDVQANQEIKLGFFQHGQLYCMKAIGAYYCKERDDTAENFFYDCPAFF